MKRVNGTADKSWIDVGRDRSISHRTSLFARRRASQLLRGAVRGSSAAVNQREARERTERAKAIIMNSWVRE